METRRLVVKRPIAEIRRDDELKNCRAYYNENDKHCVAALRELIRTGLIPDGDVDDRSIKEVSSDDIKGYTQCHFFAGIGGWAYAARLAGWGDDRQMWTGSCPCQPFSAAGKKRGADDQRHLWPDFFRLIRGCQPKIVMGEQVAGALGYGWLDGVLSDLEGKNYTGEAVDIPACSIDAPNIRSRIYWYAKKGMADAECRERNWRTIEPWRGREGRGVIEWPSAECIAMGNADDLWKLQSEGREQNIGGWDGDTNERNNGSFWSDAEWITCHDGKARRAQPCIRLLVDGLPGRIPLWRGAGNAINPILAAEVIRAIMETSL